jgi:hypothetical protein
MKRTAWLQERRMQKFRDVLSRCESGTLSMMQAGELLGMSERQFVAIEIAMRSKVWRGYAIGGLGSLRPSACRLRTLPW